MKKQSAIIAVCLIAAMTAFAAANKGIEHIGKLSNHKNAQQNPVRLKDTDRITTLASFRPPVEITIVAKTDSTNLIMAYAADDVTFNWDQNPSKLCVHGGPANWKRVGNKGNIPTKRYITIKWIVLNGRQEIWVGNDLRFSHDGDYSKIDKPVSVFCNNSEVTVKSIQVRDLTEELAGK